MVGCLQGEVHKAVHGEAQLCLTLCGPVDCSPPDSSVHGILQARILEWAAISFSGDLPDPGVKPGCPALQADSLLSEPPGKPSSWRAPTNEGAASRRDHVVITR